jgi:hypothetical protein
LTTFSPAPSTQNNSAHDRPVNSGTGILVVIRSPEQVHVFWKAPVVKVTLSGSGGVVVVVVVYASAKAFISALAEQKQSQTTQGQMASSSPPWLNSAFYKQVVGRTHTSLQTPPTFHPRPSVLTLFLSPASPGGFHSGASTSCLCTCCRAVPNLWGSQRHRLVELRTVNSHLSFSAHPGWLGISCCSASQVHT